MTTQKIVIGVIIGLVVIAFFIWLYNRSKKSTTTSTPTNTGTGERVEQTIQQPIISQPVYNQGFSYGGVPVAGGGSGARVIQNAQGR